MRTLTIVTHGSRGDAKLIGGAHADEVYSVALLIAMLQPQSVSIMRREPTQTELADPEIWVLDVGGCYDPYRHNFDHHQMVENNHCTFSLLLKYFNIEDSFKFLYTWTDALVVRDTRGPKAMEQMLGLPVGSTVNIPTAVEKMLIHAFGQRSEFHGDDLVIQMLYAMGDSWRRELDESFRWLEVNKQQFNQVEVRGVPGVIVPTSIVPRPRLITLWRNNMAKHVEWSCCLDESNPNSIRFYRFDDSPSVDFRRLKLTQEEEQNYRIIFCHATGFMCVIQWLNANAKAEIGNCICNWMSRAINN